MTVINDEENKEPVASDPGWAYNDMYPERRGSLKLNSWFNFLSGAKVQQERSKQVCETNVYECVTRSPLVKLLIGALNNAGCTFDIRRHISCESCSGGVSGGFDAELNQVIVCHNVATRRGLVQGVLTHELIHMFDYCKNDMDFRNMRHLACTEIRAANMAHCSFMSACIYGGASPFNIKARHKECVKLKALSSLQAVKHIPKEDALKMIEEVFPQCYADLEPIGRQCRRNSIDMELAYREAPLYGYDYSL